MDIRDFIVALRLLKAFYIDWSFDFSDKIQVQTWYEYLNVMDFNKFKKVISYYISKNNSGPNNPGDLLRAKIEYEIKAMIHSGEA